MTLKRSSRANSLQGSISKNRTWLTALLGLFAFLWFGVIELITLNIVYGNYDPAYSTKARLLVDLHNAADHFLGLSSYNYGLVSVMAVFLGMQGFVFLFDSKKVDFYFSQPVKKMSRFVNIYVNGILQFLCIYGCGLVLGIIIAAARGAFFAALIPSVLCGFLSMTVQFLSIYTITIFATILCGNLFAAFCSIAFFMLAEVFVRLLILGLSSIYFKTFFEDFAPLGFGITTPVLNYIHYMPDDSFSQPDLTLAWVGNTFTSQLPGLVINLVMAAVYFAVAYAVFKVRKNESAGKSVAISPMENVYKIVTAVVAGIGMELMVNGIMGDYSPFTVSGMFAMLVGIFAVCVVAEGIFALNVKSIFRRAWHMPLIFVGCLLIIAGFRYDIFGYDSYVPAESKVESVSMTPDSYTDFRDNYNSYGTLSDDENAREAMKIKDTEAAIELARIGMEYTVSTSKDNYDAPGTSVIMSYDMKNGKRIVRRVTIPFDVDASLMNTILGEDGYAEGFVGLPYSKSLADEMVSEIQFNAETGLSGADLNYSYGSVDLVEKDMSTDEAKALFNEFLEVYTADIDEYFDYDTIQNEHVVLRATLTGETENKNYRSLNYPVFANYKRTLAFFAEHGVTVDEKQYEQYVNAILGSVSQIDVERSFYADEVTSSYGVESSSSPDATESISYTRPEEIKEILLSAGRGSLYGADYDMPFADRTGYIRLQLYNREYGYINSFAVLKDRLPGFVLKDLK